MMLALVSVAGLSSCDDLFDPADDNLKDVDQIEDDRNFAQGFLMHVYRNIPGYYDNSEYATDAAVTNEIDNAIRNMATGSWTSFNDPLSKWQGCLNNIQNLNLFLDNADKVQWAEDPEVAALFKARTIGEAHGLRALFMYYLLRNHSGIAADGQLYGPIALRNYMANTSDFNIPRATFEEYVRMINEDLDIAEQNLPLEYVSLPSDATVPAPFDQYTTHVGSYNRVMGEYGQHLMNGLIARAIRSRVALLAASPAYEAAAAVTWAEAADAAADVIDHIGGPSKLASNGHTYYNNTDEIDALKMGVGPQEMIWRGNVESNRSEEENNFPPSLYGKGRMNPTQNLVDAFPMKNGYPISDSRSGYDEKNPYADRDPRLDLYIIYNGSKAGVSNTVINTSADATTADGLNKRETSTRTGYYMKKRLRMDVNCNPSMAQSKNHYTPRIRYTEIFLNYAEAANEAWGPKGTGKHGYSAYDVIKAIRTRAGITDHSYLDECAADPAKMQALIRNERRLELCFESFRFWDLRRWKADINENARGTEIRGGVHTALPEVERREFTDYMYYGPIPNSEVLKFSNLQQNAGW